MNDFWPSCGYRDLAVRADGHLQPTAAWWARWLARPELAPVESSCAAERALHAALLADPLQPVAPAALARVADADVRESLGHWLRFREAVQAAGTLQAWYLALVQRSRIDVPPLFIDSVVQCLVRHLLDDSSDAFEARAGELLFRPQRLHTDGGQALAGDRATLDLLNETGGFGELGRLLAQAQTPWRRTEIQVLSDDTAASYWASDARFDFLIDLRHTLTQDHGHGLQFTLARRGSGLAALARVLQRWVAHLLGVAVHIEPVSRIDDAHWRWHVGLDAESNALLNDLYEGRAVEAERSARMVGLFRLVFEDPQRVLPEVAGRPVYLGLAMTADRTLRLKPQNLLVNLPLRRTS